MQALSRRAQQFSRVTSHNVLRAVALETRCWREGGGTASTRLLSYRGPRGQKGWGWFHKYKAGGNEAFARAAPPTPFEWGEPGQSGRRRVWLRLEVDGIDAGRLEVELAADILPVTCSNFASLCTGSGAPERKAGEAAAGASIAAADSASSDSGVVSSAAGADAEVDASAPAYTFVGTPVHRIIKGVAVVAGDVEGLGGRGSHSALGARYFPDEAFLIPHATPGLLSMANRGRDTNGSQFYVTLAPAPHLDGRSVAFGRVLSGLDAVKKISTMFSMRGRPVSDVRIADAGIVA